MLREVTCIITTDYLKCMYGILVIKDQSVESDIE